MKPDGVFFLRVLVHVRPFVNVNTFVKLPLKMGERYSGKRARGAFFQGSYSESETRKRQSSAEAQVMEVSFQQVLFGPLLRRQQKSRRLHSSNLLQENTERSRVR